MVTSYDLTADPQLQDELSTALRGTEFWLRKVEELNDADLDAPTLLPGWPRRHLIAHVGYNAQAITRLVHWANTGVETPMYASPEQRNQEIELGATLPAVALRNLNHNAAVSLNNEWRDTPAEKWDYQVKTAQGRTVPLSETVWMRTREVWLHSTDLRNGARMTDIPEEVQSRLLGDIVTVWRNRGADPGYVITIEDREDLGVLGAGTSSGESLFIKGSLTGVLSWASGRDATQLTEGTHHVPPRWI